MEYSFLFFHFFFLLNWNSYLLNDAVLFSVSTLEI